VIRHKGRKYAGDVANGTRLGANDLVAAGGFDFAADSLTQERCRYRILPPKSLRTELQAQFHEAVVSMEPCSAKLVSAVHVRPFVFVK
jgi:hypothetical protein